MHPCGSVALYLQCPTWNVNARLALVHLVHVLDPGQLGPELLAARLALPVAGLGVVGRGLWVKMIKIATWVQGDPSPRGPAVGYLG